MKLLMPKPFRDNKITLYKNFTLIDFFVFLGAVFAGLLIVLFLPLWPIFKVLLGIPLVIPAFILVLKNKKNNCRNYQLIVRWFKFRSYIRVFKKKTVNEAGATNEIVDTFDSGIKFSDTRVMIDICDEINWLHNRFKAEQVDFLKVIDAMYNDPLVVSNIFDDIDNNENEIEVDENNEYVSYLEDKDFDFNDFDNEKILGGKNEFDREN